jgi:hypothetical protein
MAASDKAYTQMHTGSTPVYKPWSGGLPLEEQKFKRFGGSA